VYFYFIFILFYFILLYLFIIRSNFCLEMIIEFT